MRQASGLSAAPRDTGRRRRTDHARAGARLPFVRFYHAPSGAERRGKSGPSCWSGRRRFLVWWWRRQRPEIRGRHRQHPYCNRYTWYWPSSKGCHPAWRYRSLRLVSQAESGLSFSSDGHACGLFDFPNGAVSQHREECADQSLPRWSPASYPLIESGILVAPRSKRSRTEKSSPASMAIRSANWAPANSALSSLV